MKAYILARQDAANPEFSNRMKCVFFLATPHRGSDSAQLLNNILKASGALSARQYVTDLEKNSATTQTINDEFRNYADELMLWSFYETTKTSLGLSSTMIVERDSAILGRTSSLCFATKKANMLLGYKHERVQYLNANHREVCKYDDPLDPNYLTVKNALAAAVEELLKTGQYRTKQSLSPG